MLRDAQPQCRLHRLSGLFHGCLEEIPLVLRGLGRREPARPANALAVDEPSYHARYAHVQSVVVLTSEVIAARTPVPQYRSIRARTGIRGLGRQVMGLFRLFLVVLFTGVAGYTVVVVRDHGLGLFEVFFGDMARMGWAGQFNVDFMAMLALSGTWLAWRHHFSPVGILMGTLGFFGGAPVLTAYLFCASFVANGDVKELLLGQERAKAE
jgi:hypothetical protein